MLFTLAKFIIFSWISLAVLFGLFNLYIMIFYRHKNPRIRYNSAKDIYIIHLFAENLRGKKILLNVMSIYSWIFLLTWLILVIGIIDFTFNTDIVSNFDTASHTWHTPLGPLNTSEQDASFITALIGILGVKFFIVVQDFYKKLNDDNLKLAPPKEVKI